MYGLPATTIIPELTRIPENRATTIFSGIRVGVCTTMVKVEVYLSQSPQFAIQANPYFFRNLKNVLVARPDGGHGFSLGWGWWDAALG